MKENSLTIKLARASPLRLTGPADKRQLKQSSKQMTRLSFLVHILYANQQHVQLIEFNCFEDPRPGQYLKAAQRQLLHHLHHPEASKQTCY
eukprot:145030-Pelagomonas_calceolata.AAC.1